MQNHASLVGLVSVAALLGTQLTSCTSASLSSAVDFERHAVIVFEQPESIELRCFAGAPIEMTVQERFTDSLDGLASGHFAETTIRIEEGAVAKFGRSRSTRVDLLHVGAGRARVEFTARGGRDLGFSAECDDPDFQ
ncbi:MAG: hypothetical protein L6Q99_10175 [Planctomycetes bacterium]|nr:hypothetical protein [Planctomycetota bacterium]